MIGIAWRMLLRTPGTLLGALVMATVGATLLTAFAVVQDSIDRTRAPVERYTAAPVVVSGEPGAFTPDTVAAVEEVPGVAESVPELVFPAQLLGEGGAPAADQEETAQFGHAWTTARLTPFMVGEGTEPTRDDEVVAAANLAEAAGVDVGDSVEVEAGGSTHTYRLAGVVRPEQGGDSEHAPDPEQAGDPEQGEGLEHQHSLFFTPGEAERLAGRGDGRSDGIGVFLEPGADENTVTAAVRDRVEHALVGDVASPAGDPSFQVASGAERGELEGVLPDHSATAAALTMLVWIVGFMAVTVIGGALVTSVRRRARQLAVLRAVGATPRQVRALCQAEALLISVAAALAGVVLGALLAWALVAVFRELEVVSPVLSVAFGAVPVLVSTAAVVLAGQVAAWWAGRAALRLRPGETVNGGSAAPHRPGRARLRVAAGAVLLIGAGVLQALGMAGLVPVMLQASYGMIASGLVIAGVGLLGAWIIRSAAGVLRRPVGASTGVGGYLAAANVRHHHRRYTGVAAPLAVGVAIAGWALSGLPLFALSNADQTAERFDTDHVVRTPIVRDEHTGLSDEVRARVAGAPGVESAVGLYETWMDAGGGDPDPTRGTVAAGDASALLDVGEARGDLAAVDAGEGVAVGAAYADRNGLDLGDDAPVRVSGASEATVLEVVALYERDVGGQEGLLVSQDALDGVGARWHDYVLVAGASADALESAVSVTAMVEDRGEFRRTYVAERQAAVDNLGTIATALVGAFLVLAAVNALALSAADRSGDLSSLRRLGVTPRQTHAMVSWEMGLTVVPAWLLGVAATAWMAVAMAGDEVGAALWAFPGWMMLLFGVFGLATAVLGASVATRGVLRAIAP